MAESPSDVETADHPLVWRRASTCSNNSCVEIAMHGNGVAVRDSKLPHSPILIYNRAAWLEFLAGVRAGDFDDTLDAKRH